MTEEGRRRFLKAEETACAKALGSDKSRWSPRSSGPHLCVECRVHSGTASVLGCIMKY